MPQGFVDTREAQFGRVDTVLAPSVGDSLVKWWLAVAYRARVPNWDIAGTCEIDGRPGMFLIEAKAHSEELNREEAGKRKRKIESKGSQANRARIESCMTDANASLKSQTGLDWRLSVEQCYQMSNRFAWAWRLTTLGYPVILLYLGFVGAMDMADQGASFADLEDWRRHVVAHSDHLFSRGVWGRRWKVNSQSFIPIMAACEQDLGVNSGDSPPSERSMGTPGTAHSVGGWRV